MTQGRSVEPDERDTFMACPQVFHLQLSLGCSGFSFRNNTDLLPPGVLSMLDAVFVCEERSRKPSGSHCLLATPHAPMVRLVNSHSSSNSGQSLQSAGTMLLRPHFTDGETEHRLKPRAEPVHCSPGLLTRFC